jgi:DNA-binding MarR family transcriptional regulator
MKSARITGPEIAATCVCFAVRKAARLVARRYDDAFRPLNITSGQFSVMSALVRDEPVTLGVLAEGLGMDRTTLSRNLTPLIRAGLVTEVQDETDRRVRVLDLTEAGLALHDRALDIWRTVQQDSARRLGPAGWPDLKAHLAALD